MRARLTQSERGLIERAVASAEQRTGAEFVVIVANRSGRYHRAEDVIGMLAGFVVTAAVSLALRPVLPSGSWYTMPPAPLGLFGTLALFVVTAVVVAACASRAPGLVRRFTPEREMLANVQRRGADCFVSYRVSSAASRGGVLVYISLAERLVWVVADDGVNAKAAAAAELWVKVRDVIVQGYARGDGAAGIAAGIEAAAEGLAGALPAMAGDADELSNTVHVLND